MGIDLIGGKNREWNDEKIYMIYAKKMFELLNGIKIEY
jgi:hypothetical protein